MFSVTLSGKNLPPGIIWKGETTTTFERVGGCLVIQQPKPWVDQDLLLRWLEHTFPTLYDGPGQFLVWDLMRAHIGKRVKAACVKKEVRMYVVPGGLTSYLQADDVGIYKSFKDRMSGLITAGKESDAVTYMRGGNPDPRQSRWLLTGSPLPGRGSQKKLS
ncbi:hypothetical protein PC129_g20437 [Phytophthora cactorum]|nr:hypothetical protein Pcac1_g13723 [Phytophthora cactorum]KAG2792255.1 hypothetical protein PC111_g23548 [Phytophthora cactorum]KAG2792640.1 hypothetical protein PC112_g23780 [Phytophthora cactorum]KAG2811993.1 hypothetical protein PC113_g23606 [Phytophthora cactorum]KAG2872197.1 hypothetical protein PC114_g26512 [Phytophthora cactorum]